MSANDSIKFPCGRLQSNDSPSYHQQTQDAICFSFIVTFRWLRYNKQTLRRNISLSCKYHVPYNFLKSFLSSRISISSRSFIINFTQTIRTRLIVKLNLLFLSVTGESQHNRILGLRAAIKIYRSYSVAWKCSYKIDQGNQPEFLALLCVQTISKQRHRMMKILSSRGKSKRDWHLRSRFHQDFDI